MFKYVVLPIFFFACANAGYLGAPVAYHAPVVSAPVVSAPFVAAPVVKTAVPVATSYQNTYKISSGAVAYAAPVVKAAPVVAAPVALAHSVAPIAPIVKSYVSAPLVAAPAYASYAAPAVVKSAYPW